MVSTKFACNSTVRCLQDQLTIHSYYPTIGIGFSRAQLPFLVGTPLIALQYDSYVYIGAIKFKTSKPSRGELFHVSIIKTERTTSRVHNSCSTFSVHITKQVFPNTSISPAPSGKHVNYRQAVCLSVRILGVLCFSIGCAAGRMECGCMCCGVLGYYDCLNIEEV